MITQWYRAYVNPLFKCDWKEDDTWTKYFPKTIVGYLNSQFI